MGAHYRLSVIALAAGLALLPQHAAAQEQRAEDPLLAQSRHLTESFAARLQGELLAALETGGPAHAVDVCSAVAPQIAAELSRESGASISRTSLRFRNPQNAPEPWQQTLLRDFERRARVTGGTGSIEHFEPANELAPARYMRAIMTGPVCLTCHGEAVSRDVLEMLEARYPFDAARGYALGDVRGAFSVTWPQAESAAVRN